MSERKAKLGADFCARGSRAVAGVVACFDDPCLFSVLFRPCFSRLLAGQKRGHVTVAVVVCFVENCCSLGRPRCAAWE